MNKGRILVIDDNRQASRIVKLTLERTGLYEVRELNDPQQSLATVREYRPDLVLLDVDMPGVAGGEVAFQIRSAQDCETIPIVFLTSLISDREARSDGVLSGGFHFVAKPPRLDHILGCIERNLEMTQPKSESLPKEANP